MPSPPIPSGWRGAGAPMPGGFHVYRVVAGGVIGAAWGALVNIRSAILANDADVVEQLTDAGLLPADMIERAILRRVDVINADTADNLLLATQNPPDPATAMTKAYANFGSVFMGFATRQGVTAIYASAETGTISEAALEIWWDIPTVNSAGV